MVKQTATLIAILLFFGLLKPFAPEITKTIPDWLKGVIIFIVFASIVFGFVKFIFKQRKKDD